MRTFKPHHTTLQVYLNCFVNDTVSEVLQSGELPVPGARDEDRYEEQTGRKICLDCWNTWGRKWDECCGVTFEKI